VLAPQYSRKESQKLDITLDRHSFSFQSLGNLVTMYIFRVFEYQVGTSARFDPHTLGLGGESVAQGCKDLPPVAGLEEESVVGPYGPGDGLFMFSLSLS
jgi:hypothetical protein